MRTSLYAKGIQTPSVFGTVQKISDARDASTAPATLDQGIGNATAANLVPDRRQRPRLQPQRRPGPQHRLPDPEEAKAGGFFPTGVNGAISRSTDFKRRKNQ